MLKIISKISYKFSANAIYILSSIFADQVLPPNEFGRFTLLLAIQILIFNISDLFNSKYLLGRFSSQNGEDYLRVFFIFKAKWGILFVATLSLFFYFYGFSWEIIIIYIFINYIQLLSSTLATYVFSTEKSITLLLSNIVGSSLSMIYLYLYSIFNNTYNINLLNILIKKISHKEVFIFLRDINLNIYFIFPDTINLNNITIAILLYRIGEICFLISKFYKKIYFTKLAMKNNFIKESYPFYLQLVLSVMSAKLFVMFLPLILTYDDISIIGTYEYLIAIPLFFISVISMSVYSELFNLKLDIYFDLLVYKKILKEYYVKSFFILSVFFILQVIYIYFYKEKLINYVIFLFFQNITMLFTSIQGYILFFWKMKKLIIYISLFFLIFKNSLMIIILPKIGLNGFFITTLISDIIVLVFIRYKVNQEIKIKRTI